ncbi:MAG: HEAT repeat domain-containing protein [Thermodesulfobacteriota bacterium]|nr:HEAT repeat domain-containing protein [Thermodesulfobacteriota bacterium]
MQSGRRELLLAALKDGDECVRHAAAAALERLDICQSFTVLEQKLATGDRHERVAAVYSLALLNSDKSHTLLTALLKDPDADVRAVAVQMLGEKLLPEALSGLVQCLKDNDVAVAVYAAGALSGYNDERLLPYLETVCRQAGTELSCAALSAIGKLGFVQSESFICPYVQDRRPEIRIAAVTALGALRCLAG